MWDVRLDIHQDVVINRILRDIQIKFYLSTVVIRDLCDITKGKISESWSFLMCWWLDEDDPLILITHFVLDSRVTGVTWGLSQLSQGWRWGDTTGPHGDLSRLRKQFEQLRVLNWPQMQVFELWVGEAREPVGNPHRTCKVHTERSEVGNLVAVRRQHQPLPHGAARRENF